MIKKPVGGHRTSARIPKIRPASQPGWYKRFKQLADLADRCGSGFLRPNARRKK